MAAMALLMESGYCCNWQHHDYYKGLDKRERWTMEKQTLPRGPTCCAAAAPALLAHLSTRSHPRRPVWQHLRSNTTEQQHRH